MSLWISACAALVLTAPAEQPKGKRLPRLPNGTARPEAERDQREQVEVHDVVVTPGGQYIVVLRTKAPPARLLPIFVGEPEAIAIRLRLDRRQPPRPLTLNLLESVLAQNNIRVSDIAIDDLKGEVFLGKIGLRQGSRAWHLDARPSDAIGLALGTGAPIWVSRRVLLAAGFDVEELRRQLEADDGEPGPTPMPEMAPAVRYDETL